MEESYNEFFKEQTDTMKSTRPCGGKIHVVKEGDTLYKIANMHGVRVLDLLLANPYVDIYNLQINDEICVPIKAVPVQDQRRNYVIKEGDTLGMILKKTGKTYEELVKSNPFFDTLALPAQTVLFY